MVEVAIVNFRDVAYWGYPSSGTWHFTEINGIKHFRATKTNETWWHNYEDLKDVKGIDFGDNDSLYATLKSVR